MATAVTGIQEQKASQAQSAVAPAREDLKTDAAPLITPDPAPLPPIPQAPGTGDAPQDFVRANRIHVKNGSLFIDPYLVVHPRELDPANEAQLRKKLHLTYSINNPSFFEMPERTAIALNLGQLVPVSLAAKRSQLMEQVRQFNAQVDQGSDPALQHLAHDKRNPFAAIVRDTVGNPAVDPAGLELLKNGLGIYLLVRQKLTENGYYNRLTDYVVRTGTADQVLGDLAEHIGVTPQQVREAALSGGIGAVGALLGLAPDYVRDAQQVAEYAATQDFGYNVVEHWHLGRQLLGTHATLQQKIAAGMDARITAKIGEYRARVHHHYDTPIPVQQQESRIADGLNLVAPIQRKLMYALGYEICFSPEMTADDIAFYRGVYGLHRKAANDLRDIRGTYRIYFSGKGEAEGSMRTLVHEIAHNFWPEQFTPQQVQRIDALANADAARFEQLHALMNDATRFEQFNRLLGAYHAGSAPEKEAVIGAANEMLQGTGIRVDTLFPAIRDAHELRHMVAYAQDTLQVEGSRYARSGYDTPQERFREVISRFAELKQVRLRNTPEMLEFICPNLNQVWDEHYIPHLERVYQQVLRNSGVPHAPVAAEPQPAAARPPAEPQPEPKVEERPAPARVAEAASRTSDTPATTIQRVGTELAPALQALQQMQVRYAL